jgi:cation:H+ antiporter
MPIADLLLPLLSIAAGLAVLVAGGEALVRGASALAALLRVSPLVIGLTVVAFGTSAPELAVSVQAAYGGNGDLAAGNLVGSNIANVLLILGLSALIAPLVVASKLVRIDVPLVIGASVLFLLLGMDGVIGRWDGALLFFLLLAYIAWSIREGRSESQEIQEELSGGGHKSGAPPRPFAFQALLILAGLVLLVSGARWLVGGAVDIARLLGISELVIGLTIVAVGTSLPELVTSILAAVRGERELAVGNVVGSNLFNILGVLGLASLVSPTGIPVSPAALALDIPIMIAAAVACLPIFLTGHHIARWEGALFFFYYIAYLAYLVLDATQHAGSEGFALVMTTFVIPLTILTLGICTLRALRGRSTPPA